ncbi:MAG TPA: ABC transporter ATP-binding protein [Blastocatellia bacterium]|nr:ABC transporter ATP-binding protein [Blastocatellia bacterium]HMY76871.1 ABC transporter ATP-binding protein [Blastocatellia bacterium]HNG32881.1 ABC transporter ATP-binding protein [Blastocatellia bacterium]
MPILLADEIRKIYAGGEAPVEAVRGVSLTLETGDFVALMGPSGCGKSTLLHLCGAMDRPTAGLLQIENTELGKLNDDQLTRLRRERIGFVFQFFNLLPTLTVMENVTLPMLLDGGHVNEAERRAKQLAERVGLSHRLWHYPQQLSGGEMQRAAIARAVIHQPALLIADEPTGNLDSENGVRVLSLLSELNRELGLTILLATHGAETAAAAKRIVKMRDGQIESIAEQKPEVAQSAIV